MSSADPHPDAFRLITYMVESTRVRELVWNATTSPAPATIQIRGGDIASRVIGHEPRLAHHCPSVGDIVLIEPSWEWAVPQAYAEADRTFPDGGEGWYECLAALLRQHSIDIGHHAPRPEVVTEALRSERGWTALRAG